MQAVSRQGVILHLLQHASRQGSTKRFDRAANARMVLPKGQDALDKTELEWGQCSSTDSSLEERHKEKKQSGQKRRKPHSARFQSLTLERGSCKPVGRLSDLLMGFVCLLTLLLL